MKTVYISTITLKQGKTEGYCNVVNPNRKRKEPEYLQKILETNYTKYLNLIEKIHGTTHWIYKFTSNEIDILIKEGNIRTLILRPSLIYIEEIEEIKTRLQQFLNTIQFKQLFFRTYGK